MPTAPKATKAKRQIKPRVVVIDKGPYIDLADKFRPVYESRLPSLDTSEYEDGFVFAIVPVAIYRMHHLSVHARFLWGYLISRAGKTRGCFPSLVTMGQDLDISPSQISRFIKELEETGLLEIKKVPIAGTPRKRNHYILKSIRHIVGSPAMNDQWGLYDWIRKTSPESFGGGGALVADGDGEIEAEDHTNEPTAMEDNNLDDTETCNSASVRLQGRKRTLAQVQGKQINIKLDQEKIDQENNNYTAPEGAVSSSPGGEPQNPDEPQNFMAGTTAQENNSKPVGSTVQLKDIVGGAFKKSASQIPEPGEGSGFRRLREHERLAQKEERKVAKAFQAEQREKAILEGSIDRQAPHVRLGEAFRETMVASGFKAWKQGPKELGLWRRFIEKVGSFEEASKVVSHTISNWKALQTKYEKLTGDPGPYLFLSPWGITLAKESEGTASSSKAGELSPTESPRQQQRYREAEEIANLMLARLQGQPYDAERLATLEMGGPNAEWITEHLNKLRYYDIKREIRRRG